MKKVIFFLLITAVAGFLMRMGEQSLARQHVQEQTITLTDSLGRRVVLPYPLTRVAVVNPYNAELIAAVGAENTICGIDKDIYENRAALHVPLTKDMIVSPHGETNLNLEQVIRLKPQVLILDAGFHYERDERVLGLFGIKVFVLRADSAEHFPENCHLMGQMFGREKEAAALCDYFEAQKAYIDQQLRNVPRKKVYYECRRSCRSVILGEAFNEMLDVAHADNIFADANSIFISNDILILRNPSYIIRLSDVSEPYSYHPPSEEFFRRIKQNIRGRACWDYIDAVKEDNILLYSYYAHGGAAKYVGAMYLAKYLYPEQLPELDPEEVFRVWLTRFQRLDYMPGHTYPSFAE